MGIDLCLLWNDERVAELGRAHNYEDTSIDTLKSQLTGDLLGHLCYQPESHEKLLEIIRDMTDAIETLCENEFKRGQISLLNDLRDQGFETVTDIEWDERKAIKNKPDYINPKFK